MKLIRIYLYRYSYLKLLQMHPLADSDRFPYVPTFLSEFFSISRLIDHRFTTISITNTTNTCQQKTFSRLRLFSVVRSLQAYTLTPPRTIYFFIFFYITHINPTYIQILDKFFDIIFISTSLRK